MEHVKLEKLPRETLMELARMYAQNWQTLDGLWFRNVEAQYGPKAAVKHLICPPDPHPKEFWCKWELTMRQPNKCI
jgi:hypothetical protein